MSSATVTPGTGRPVSGGPVSLRPVPGATALGTGPADEHRHLVGNALRAIKVFAGAALSVVLLGEYADEGG